MNITNELKKFELRDEQKASLDFIKRVFDKTNKKFILLDLPPGVGKSLIALESAKMYMKKNPGTKIDVVTAGKLLQDQYSREFKFMGNLKGKDNYTCERYNTSCSTGKDFCRLNKESKCDGCPYDEAKMNYLVSDISLTNFQLYLINQIYSIEFFKERKKAAKLLIVDEAHLFDDTISTFFQIKTTEHTIKKLHLKNEAVLIRELNLVTNVSEYLSFLSNLVKIIEQVAIAISVDDIKREKETAKMIEKMLNKKVGSLSSPSEELISTLNVIQNLYNKLLLFFKEYEKNTNNWIFIKEVNDKNEIELILEPIWTGEYLKEYIWNKYDHVILMSGTILDKEVFSYVNGIDSSNSFYYNLSSPFPLKNRPIIYMPLGKMSYSNKMNTFELYKEWLPKLLKKYKNKKGIIHTNSFELMEWIVEGVNDDRLLHHDSSNKDDILDLHFSTSQPTVLVSPSMSTGISFDDDKARFQIIAKIPYPSLASEKNKMRHSQNKDWYALATVQNLIQAFGRICRSNIDYGDTIIIDSSFTDIMRFSSKFLPYWIQESIKHIDINKIKNKA